VFKCEFFKVPLIRYSPGRFPKKKFKIEDPGVNTYMGTLNAQLSEADVSAGNFKTAHLRKVQITSGSCLLPNGKVCIKQVFDRKPDGGIARLKGRHELKRLSVKCNSLIWASILLNLTYQFTICKIGRMGDLSCPIPVILMLHFTISMIAIV